jgi:hypothetical protein
MLLGHTSEGERPSPFYQFGRCVETATVESTVAVCRFATILLVTVVGLLSSCDPGFTFELVNESGERATVVYDHRDVHRPLYQDLKAAPPNGLPLEPSESKRRSILFVGNRGRQDKAMDLRIEAWSDSGRLIYCDVATFNDFSSNAKTTIRLAPGGGNCWSVRPPAVDSDDSQLDKQDSPINENQSPNASLLAP